MEHIFKTQTNIVIAVTLLLISIISYFKINKKDKISSAYLVTSAIIIVQLLLEALVIFIANSDKNISRHIIKIIYLMLFLNGPILVLYWYRLLSVVFSEKRKNDKLLTIIIYLPQLLNTIFIGASIFTGGVFYLDQNNLYHRGDLFWVHSLITYFYLVLSLGLVIKNAKNIQKSDLYILILAIIIPLIGGIIQIAFYGILLIWASVGISMIILLLFVQQRVIQFDYLTKVWNRETLLNYINQRVNNENNLNFGALYIDLNNLKKINDGYGHKAGDIALKNVADLIRRAVGEKTIISRIGGDEFIVILDVINKQELKKYVSSISFEMEKHNENSETEYKMSIAIGADIFDERFTNFSDFIEHIDILMYEDKKCYKESETT